jgi:hypothetical protein
MLQLGVFLPPLRVPAGFAKSVQWNVTEFPVAELHAVLAVTVWA